MTSNPEEIRAEIERTRANLSNDVNALADEANPKNIAKRQVDKVKDGAVSVKDRIMGSASDVAETASDKVSALGDKASAVGDRASDRSSAVGGAVAGAPTTVKRKAQGNPLGAGLVAFGLGYLVSSLIPVSDREQEAAAGLKAKAEPLKEKLTEFGKDVASNLQAPVQDAVASVKETATGSVQTVKDEGTSAASEVKGQVQDSKDSVQGQVRDSKDSVQGQVQDSKESVQATRDN
jgi:hypothetical protein